VVESQVLDYSFEDGPDSAYWSMTSSNSLILICCGDEECAGVLPYFGNCMAWFGGIFAAEYSTLQQTVFFPYGSKFLSFYMQWADPSSPQNFTVAIDDSFVITYNYTTMYNGIWNNFAPMVDPSFSDNHTHVVTFYFTGLSGASVYIDNVSLKPSQLITTNPLTTSPLTTQGLTTAELTSVAVVTTQPTTSAITTQPLSTSFLTTQPLSTSPLTTQPAVTTQPLTSSPLTTQALSTEVQHDVISSTSTESLTTGVSKANTGSKIKIGITWMISIAFFIAY